MIDISTLFSQNGGKTAGFPNTDYPRMQFTGPQSLQPKGGTAETSHSVTPAQRKHMVIVIAVIAVGVYILWHFNYERG
jgi:hypothetical protein